MRIVDPAGVRAFRAHGYAVLPAVLDDQLLARGRQIAAAMLAEQPPPTGHAGPYFLWPRFGPAPHPLLGFYRDAGLDALAVSLLRPGLAVTEPEGAQLAITIPPWPHRPGGPHVDGLTPAEADGRPGTFSLLCGVWLSDQHAQNQGNLWVWPGTHLRFGAWLSEHGPDALGRTDLMNPGPYPPVELGEPVQLTGPAGSVLFAHYLLAHNIGGHDGPAGAPRREVVYYRLRAAGHVHRWREVVTSPLAEIRA